MSKSNSPGQVPMTVQPLQHGSTIPTPSLPRQSNVNPKTVATHQNKRQRNEEAIRTVRVREGIRLELFKQAARSNEALTVFASPRLTARSCGEVQHVRCTFRQSYLRVAKRAAMMAGRYAPTPSGSTAIVEDCAPCVHA